MKHLVIGADPEVFQEPSKFFQYAFFHIRNIRKKNHIDVRSSLGDQGVWGTKGTMDMEIPRLHLLILK